MNDKPLYPRRLRLVLALAVAMIGAALVQGSLTKYVASVEWISGAPASGDLCGSGLILYGLVFGLAYWIAPKWG